ncbi:MAG: hypothetical protein A3I68_08145 [Candidatus Melainabacteria bacterium RIFCSPLOWO2_02_FULL_35_15]|nr:MAG: hypothetical protein A3I68_08145 [Candidatus Melainabacteria bacterium RIFCSPLOWO2_02_FULL_35_15]
MPKRTEPDEILKQIVKLSSGRHKIFLGMAPGVGKTYRMLEEAKELKKKGIDIVIGYIETQSRAENLNLINIHEVIPKQKLKVNNTEFYDLDLEAILERRPATVIIDELAHNNFPGSLNQKRYQDVQELLKNGISVLSTLNIHQLDSIAPVIEKNIGTKINETVPDWILNQADELVLIDIPIDELYHRLQVKQIYSEEQLKHAMKYFFKRSNLALLRDLALNIVAERVDAEVVSEKLSAKIKARILVAASPKETSLNLIRHAAEISKSSHADLDVLCILTKNIEQNLINDLREVTRISNGNFFLVKDIKTGIAEELIHFIKSNRITQVVMGYSKIPPWKQLLSDSKVFKVLEQTSNLDVLIINSKKDSIKSSIETIKSELEITDEKPSRVNFGKLKIYIGMAPGVGKTYKMLQDAKELHDNGKNILLGIIDTHGRSETAELMAGLNILPPKLIEHKGKYLQEFDLESGILAKPEYILIDELAHTNVPGAINNKRYQDVQYLLRAGINVMSTVNIQHIESLNDIVEQVTGIKVRETVPDWIISHASEIVLIDLSPEALQERLKAGKVYSLDKIEQALTHFFQKKNLIALRELSLREVAESVEHEMYPKEKKLKVLCFVEIASNTLRLIRKSARIANRLQAELIVMHIAKNTSKLTEEKKIAIIELEQLIVELGGDFRLVEGKDIVNEVINAVTKVKPDYTVIGEARRKGIFTLLQGAILRNILNKMIDSHTWVIGDFTREPT